MATERSKRKERMNKVVWHCELRKREREREKEIGKLLLLLLLWRCRKNDHGGAGRMIKHSHEIRVL